MVTDQLMGLAAEHARDLLLEADHRRLAARVACPATLRQSFGSRLVSLGLLISGDRGGPTITDPNPLRRKEVGEWKPC
jgi:hypothetical protein